jgi:peptidoglycan hydrolase CwlO-like protein
MINFKLITILLSAFFSITTVFAQNLGGSDTICLPKADALRVLEAGLNSKVYKEKIDSLTKYVDGLKALIEVRSARIANLSNEIENYDKVLTNYKKEIKTLEDQKGIAQGFINSLNKEVRKQKRKTTVVALLGVLASAGAFYIGSR